MIKTIAKVLVVGAALSSTVAGKSHIRYNRAGYFPNETKKFVVLSDENVSGNKWSITQNGQEVLSGTIGTSISGKSEHTPFSHNYNVDFTSLNNSGDYQLMFDGKSHAVKISTGF